jgi:excinuclease UvrABC ATPase subunit
MAGEIVAEGTPEAVCDTPGSYTGEFLRRFCKDLAIG